MTTMNIEPYVGPRPFQRIDEALFFGREKEAGELLSLIIANPILLIYARSGAGKTSLINARLFPLLEREEIQVLPIARVQGRIPQGSNLSETPGANVYVFNTLASWKKEGDDPAALMKMTLAEFLGKERQQDSGNDPQSRPRVIFLDQFEELFTFYPDRWKDRWEFFRQVSDLLEGGPLLLRASDLQDPAGLMKEFISSGSVLSKDLWARLSPEAQELSRKQNGVMSAPDTLKPLLDDLNRIIQSDSLYFEKAFAQTELRSEAVEMIRQQPSAREIPKLNRMLLEDAYPVWIRRRLNGDPLLRIVFSMREDYIAELDPYASVLPNKLRARYRLEPLRQRAALSAVKGPLEKTDLSFAPGVGEHLVENLLKIQMKTAEGVTEIPGEFVEPVQLQVVCQSLWDNVQATGEKEITEDHLRKYGNVGKALRAFYEKTIQKVIEAKRIKEWVLRRWFEDVLITTAGTRGMVFRGTTTTGGLSNDVVDELESQHIIRAELRGGERWYELSHDRFIQPIRESNNDWRLTRSGAVSKRNELEAKASVWMLAGRGESGLLDESAAIEAKRWLESSEAAEVGYSEDLFAFVQSSRLAVSKAKHEHERAIFEREMQQAEAIAQEQKQRAEAEQARREEQERRAEAERLRAEEQERRAEAERLRAEEQKRLADTERARAEEKAQSSARLRKLITGLAVMFILAAGTAIYAYRQRSQALASADQARSAAERANQQSELAKKNETEAIAAQEESEKQRKIAEANAEDARQKGDLAIQKQQLAETETKRASEQTALARRQELIAKEAVKEAEKQKDIAEDRNKQLISTQSALEKALVDAKSVRDEAVKQTEVARTALANEAAARALAEKRLNEINEVKTVEKYKEDAARLERNQDWQGALDNYRHALDLYRKSESLPNQPSNKSSQALVLESIGRVQSYSASYSDSVKSYNEALTLIDPTDQAGRARVLMGLGVDYQRLMNGDEAIKRYEEALKISETINDLSGKFNALMGIANAKINQGDYKGVEDANQYALKVALAQKAQYNLAVVYDSFAYLRYKQADYNSAADYYQRALKIYQNMNYISPQETDLNSLIDIYRKLNNKSQVDKYTQMLQELQGKQKAR